MPVKKNTKKIIVSRLVGWAVWVGGHILGIIIGWNLYKYGNRYLGYTSGLEFWEMGISGFIEFFDDFDSPNLKIALMGTLFAGITGIIKAFRNRG